ncbi:MAG: sensor histidine kinase [Acidimicrobiales bacterium]|jgi:two-component sensor histidine kinase
MDSPLVSPPVKVVPVRDLIRRHTELGPAERRHLESLMTFWGLLADFSFSDLLLFAPVTRDAQSGGEESPAPGVPVAGVPIPGLPGLGVPASRELMLSSLEPIDPNSEAARSKAAERLSSFVVLGQMRPTTSHTLYEVDLVGQVQSIESLSNVASAYRAGQTVRTEQPGEFADAPVRVTYTPVRHRGKVIAVLCRVWSPVPNRRWGTLERVYLDLYERLSAMVADGSFPFVEDPASAGEAPRVGDGVLVLDERTRIAYASPNAVNALHRASITSAIVGSTLASLGLETSVVDRAFASKLPVIEEVERRPDVSLLLRCIPLVSMGELTGAAILVRDVTDLRRRDRLLLSKDATIREVHHRVKNNLQTISSLLRLQARRLDEEDEAVRIALMEAERRIRAIAVVHDILARDATEQVSFEEIVAALLTMIRETSTISFPVTIEVDGSLGDVAAEVATPLAVAVAELLQNAVEHAFVEQWSADGSMARAAADAPRGPEIAPRVDLVLREDPDALRVEVRDNGCGLPHGFDIDRTRSLGLSIVRDLVRGQLGGTIEMENDSGAVVRLGVPVSRQAE